MNLRLEKKNSFSLQKLTTSFILQVHPGDKEKCEVQGKKKTLLMDVSSGSSISINVGYLDQL